MTAFDKVIEYKTTCPKACMSAAGRRYRWSRSGTTAGQRRFLLKTKHF